MTLQAEDGRCIVTRGGIPLKGTVKIQGSKNAGLPILAATILTEDENCLENCPRITDIMHMLEILEDIGVKCSYTGNGLWIDSGRMLDEKRVDGKVTGMRAGICLLGALLGRGLCVSMDYPGGCMIGDRPIDLHIEALQKMGVCFAGGNCRLEACAPCGLKGAVIRLSYPSVGATENILLAAVRACGETQIIGAAKEPEIASLCEYLNCCGARIRGGGTDRIVIEGVEKLHGCRYRIPADRIVAGTYAYAVLATGGEAFLERAVGHQMDAVLKTLSRMGGHYQIEKNGVYIQGTPRIKNISYLKTATHPGFPTDMQSVALAVLAQADGDSMLEETVFENRFATAKELEKMGAGFTMIDEHAIWIRGTRQLKGCRVCARDLRGGAALVVAGLCAAGETRICQVDYIERGYENICRDIQELGGRIYCCM